MAETEDRDDADLRRMIRSRRNAVAETEDRDDADLRRMIRDPRYQARGRAGDAWRAEVTARFAARYPDPAARDLSGRMVHVRAYERRGDQGGVEQVRAHQRGSGVRAGAGQAGPGRGGDTGHATRTPATGRRGTAARPPAAFVAPQLIPTPVREWERPEHPNREFRHAIAVSERSAQREDHGYGDRREDWGAVGRYQMRAPALRAIRWLPRDSVGPLRRDTTGWNIDARNAGVNSVEDFLRTASAQETAFTEHLRAIERELVASRLWSRIGETVRIGSVSVELTAPGLVAAAHRVGTVGLRDVLAGTRPELAGPALTRLRDFGARDTQGSLRIPYAPVDDATPRIVARPPHRGAR